MNYQQIKPTRIDHNANENYYYYRTSEYNQTLKEYLDLFPSDKVIDKLSKPENLRF